MNARNDRASDCAMLSACCLLPTAFCLLFSVLGVSLARPLYAQVESIEGPPQRVLWGSHGRVEGHLALNYSPAGAFSPDSSTLAVINKDKVAFVDLSGGSIRKVLHPHVAEVTELEIQSANFLSPTRLFLLGNGWIQPKGKGIPGATPLLAFQWFIDQDELFDKVHAVGGGGGFGPIVYFPHLGYVGLQKENRIDLWSPASNRGGPVNIPELTRKPNLFAFSPDGHWLLLAQIEMNSTADPVVVRLSDRKFVDTVAGHHGTVLSMSFSRDSQRLVTACEDGKVRIWSVPDWKLLQTLEGHQGPVHWAEFSLDGNRVVSGGEDKTVRIWSVRDGKPEQTLEESQAPILTVAFSPNGEYVAATSESLVLMWKRR